MAVTQIPPLNLPVSKLTAQITTLICDVRFSETLAPSDIVNELVDGARQGNVDFGKGIVKTFKVDLQPIKDLSETSSAFTITKPNVGQEVITIDNYKFIPISTSSYLTKDAFRNGYALDEFFAFVMSLLDTTYTFHMYDVVNNLLQNWTPGQATQTITINLTDTADLTGTELQAASERNATTIAKTIRKTLNNMKVLNPGYSDVSKYTGQDGSTQYDVRTALRGDELKITMNDNFMTDILADSLATLYHENYVGDMIPARNRITVIPTSKMSSGNTNVIGWMYHVDKFAFADFYRTTLSIVDPSTLYENSFQHFAYGAGVFKYAPGVKFVANYA